MTVHHDIDERPIRRYLTAALKVIGLVIVFALLTHMSWNLFAPDLFGLPEVRMKQALGLVVFGGLVAYLLRQGLTGRTDG